MLSLKNLFTKKGRTALTTFAGSIGIMGIALILAVSQGTTRYINYVQEDTLASYPLAIEKTTVDMSSLMETFMNVHSKQLSHDLDAVYQKSSIYNMLTAMNNLDSSENDLSSFKTYLDGQILSEDEGEDFSSALTGVQYSYDLNLLVYTKNVDGDIIKSDTRALLQELLSEYMGADTVSFSSMSGDNSMFGSMATMESLGSTAASSMGMMTMNLWQEMLTGKDGALVNELLKKQYDVVYGSWPSAYNELVLVLDKNNELDDMTLYALGLQPKEQVDAIMSAAIEGTELEKSDTTWSFEDICNTEFRVILNADCYSLDSETGLYTDLRETNAGLRYLYDKGLVLKVTGIIRPSENAQSAMLSGSIAYTKALTEYVVEQTKSAPVIAEQMGDGTRDVLTGLPFKTNTGNLTDGEKEQELRSYLAGLDEGGKAAAYVSMMSIPPREQLETMTAEAVKDYSRDDIEAAMAEALTQQMGVDGETLQSYISSMSDEDIKELFSASVAEKIRSQYAERVQQQMAAMSAAQLAGALSLSLDSFSPRQFSDFYDEIMVFSDSSYETNLTKMGYVDLEAPTAINLYASSFENKDIIEDAISEYNEGVDDLSRIKYTDYVGIMMSSVTTIINAITYVLLAFVAISLIVSSIMIGVITLISVQERTKEIGILRAIGASKSDVSSMFNAETAIIGFASGLLGITVTYLLCIPINMLLHRLTGIPNLNAYLPVQAAVLLILISVVLSLIAGLIPSRSAAKKDPVVALRTE